MKVKMKNICSFCQGEIPKQEEHYITCPLCGNETWQVEIIEEFEERLNLKGRIKKWLISIISSK